MNRSTFSGNTQGGAIWNVGGSAEITDSVFLNNTTTSSGGAIWHDGAATLTVRGTTFVGNSAAATGSSNVNFGGCAIFLGAQSILNLSNSTFSGNSTQGKGGAMHLFAQSAIKSITNTTLSSNSSNTEGGGIYQDGNTLTFMNNTVVGNTANDSTGGGIYAAGGLIIGNSLLIGNTAQTYPTLNSTGTFRSRGHNIFGENTDFGLSSVTVDSSDIALPGMTATAVGPLADNGGPTPTHLPVTGSLAINGGDNALIPANTTTDGRGYGPRIVGGAVDIGAVETGATPPTFKLAVNKTGGLGTVKSTPSGIDCGGTCAAEFEMQAPVTLNAVADAGFKFSSWSGDCQSSTASCALKMDAAKNVTAMFERLPTLVLTLSKAGTGSGTVSGGGNYAAGAAVTLKATPAAGSVFAGWKPSPCAASFKMPANALTCTATFNLATVSTFALKTLVAGSGTGTVTGAGKYASGAAVTLKATPAKGSVFVTWAPSACANSFKMPNRPLTCVAIFSSTGYTLTTVVGGFGSGTVTGAGSYAMGATVKLTATPAVGSTFVGWAPAPCGVSFIMPNRPMVCAAIFN